MNGSHASLRDDYAVSSPELDFVVDSLQREDGVLGARMTGGGFGGSVVALVKDDAVAEVSAKHRSSFRARYRVEPTVIVTEAGDGMRAEIIARA